MTNADGQNEPILLTLLNQRRKLLGYLRSKGLSDEVAEDLLQELSLKILNQPPRDIERIISWLYAALRNLMIDHLRKQNRAAKKIEKFVAGEDFHFEDLESTVCRCINDLLPLLRPTYNDVLRAVEFDEKDYAELAKADGVSENTVAVRAHRAREALKKELVNLCGACSTHGCLNCECHNKFR